MSSAIKKVEPPSYNLKASKERMRSVLKDVLEHYLPPDKKYTSDDAAGITKLISNDVRDKLKELALPRYKYMVHVTLGEQRTEGVHVGTRCLWDADTDNYASVTFTNDSIFCVATAYGVYQY